MRLPSRDYSKIAINSLTDPGVLFNLGNAPISLSQSVIACSVNLTVAAIVFFVRILCEYKAYGITIEFKHIIGRQFNVMADNKGAALMTSGFLTLVSAIAALLGAFLGSTSSPSYLPAAMLGCFGCVHLFRGIATGPISHSKKCSLDAMAFLLATTGYLFANPNLPLFVMLGYAIVTCMAIYMVVKQQSLGGFRQPDLYFAATSFFAAIVSDVDIIIFGFTMWACGYLSIYALRSHEGVFQTVQILCQSTGKFFKTF